MKEKRAPVINDAIMEYLPILTTCFSVASGFRYFLYISIDQSVDTELKIESSVLMSDAKSPVRISPLTPTGRKSFTKVR